MLDVNKAKEMIEGFGSHYNYDVGFMRTMLKESEDAFEAFQNFLPMGQYKKVAPLEEYFICKLNTMKVEDCGACLQLNVDMAIEAGISKELVHDVVFNEGKNLSKKLKDVYDFSLDIAKNSPHNQDLYDRITKEYTTEMLVEFSFAIASSRVYPAIKRVLNEAKSCKIVQIKV